MSLRLSARMMLQMKPSGPFSSTVRPECKDPKEEISSEGEQGLQFPGTGCYCDAAKWALLKRKASHGSCGMPVFASVSMSLPGMMTLAYLLESGEQSIMSLVIDIHSSILSL